MRSSRTHYRPTIGVLAGWSVFTGILDSFLGHVFRGIQAAAHDYDCNLLMACGIDRRKSAWPLLANEVDFVPVGPWNTDGLIIVSPFASEAGDQFARDLIAKRFPVVYAGDRDSGPAVVADNTGGIKQAVQHLVEHGHRRIAYIAGRRHSEHGDSGIRLRAFKETVETLNLSYDPGLVAHGLHTYDGGHKAIKQIIERRTNFSAVIASNDGSAMGVLDGLKEVGFSVPQDIALVGFDDRLEARALIPPLTTVHYPMFDLGYQSVVLLLKAINEDSVIDDLVIIPSNLVIRESCGCVPSIPTAMEEQKTKKDELVQITRKTASQQLVQEITTAIHQQSMWLSQDEIGHLAARLVEAFILSLEQDDPLDFLLMIKQILAHVSVRGDDLFSWQSAVTILRDQLPLISQVAATQLSAFQVESLLHQGRVAISEVALGQFTRSLIHQTEEADQIGRITSEFFAAHSEHEIFDLLTKKLPAIGIQRAIVGYYQTEDNDPVNQTVLQSAGKSISDSVHMQAGARFPSRIFPPDGLYPDAQAFQLAVLPLNIQDKNTGFVAFETANLGPCADIVRQLGAALRSVRLYQQAVEAKQLAEEANRLKSRFLSMVSHELRTPLNLITGISNILLEEDEFGFQTHQLQSRDNVKEDLQRIYISAQHLDGLIRDVLDLASSDIGQLKLACEPLDMTEVLQAVAVIGEQLARDKGLSFQVEIPENLPHVWGDRTRLRQVALNLVNNAIKFTDRGEIGLTAIVEDRQIIVSVSDTGLGIPSDEQAVIFDEFRQSERTTARGYGGLGLGLAICRKLVEMHEGEIGVCSSGDEGEGSMFFFSLPVLERRMDLTADIVPFRDGQRVLMLVKQTKGSDLIMNRLTEQGYQVELCQIHEQSDWLATLLFAEPDIVMLDLGLTSSHGWEIIKTLKEHPSTREIPVMFYKTADETGGASLLEIDYLTKPVSTEVLENLLSSRGFAEANSASDKQDSILIVDDEPGVLELHTRILESQFPDHHVLMANDGRQALEIISQERPALVLLDLMMPELDGFAVLEEMHNNDLTRNIPVVVITGQVLTEEDMQRLNAGVASVLGKGMFSENEIMQHLSNALERRRVPGSESQRIVQKAMAYIQGKYHEPISRSDVAAHVGLSERHLTRCFHQEVGITPITYLNRYRVKQAKAMLDTGDKGITEIALQVGFSSHSYFSRVFRDQVGVSPRAYMQSRCAA